MSNGGRADLLIVAGTSLTVYPAAGFVTLFRGENLVLINKSETPMDPLATLVIRQPVGQGLERAVFPTAYESRR